MPRLDVRVVCAKNLPDVETFGKIDPYATVELEGKRYHTTTVDDTENPVWEEVFKFNVADDNSAQVHFRLFNKNTISDDFLGEYTMSVCSLTRGVEEEKVVLLQQCKSNAELVVKLLAHDFGKLPEGVTEPPPPPQEEVYQYQPPAPPEQWAPPPQRPMGMPMNGWVYTLAPQNAPGKALDCAGGGAEPGTEVLLWPPHGGPNQKFRAIDRGNGYFSFVPQHAQHLALEGGPQGSIAHLGEQQGDNAAQLFRLHPTTPGHFSMHVKADERCCFDMAAGSDADGTKVCIWEPHGGANQQFSFNQA